MNIWSVIGLVFVAYVAFNFIRQLGNRIPILELLMLIAGLQWIVGAAIEYRSTSHHFKYYMYVDEAVYMGYVVPAYIVFSLIILMGIRYEPKLMFDINSFDKFAKYGKYILLLGIFFDFSKTIVPGGLQFVFYLLSHFKFVGAIILFFSVKKMDRYVFYGALLYLLWSSIKNAFFHELILWGSFFFMFWAYKEKPKFYVKVAIIVFGVFASSLIQSIKLDYRSIIQSNYQGNRISLFFNSIFNELPGNREVPFEDESGELNVRLNQGWIISAVLDYTPRAQPFANGSTIKEAVFASIMPRVLNPDKKIAGGVENFEKYTGIPLSTTTSMGLSIVGEAYANFGVTGGIVFMLIWGFVLLRFWFFILNQIQKRTLLLFFLPLLFLQVVKAETELVVVLNHLVKSLLLVILFFWATTKFVFKEFNDVQ